MTDVRTARILDLPSGGFVVLDHVAAVGISKPYYIVQGGCSHYFNVGVTTTHGANIHCRSFLAADKDHYGSVDEQSVEYATAKADAEAYVGELRALL